MAQPGYRTVRGHFAVLIVHLEEKRGQASVEPISIADERLPCLEGTSRVTVGLYFRNLKRGSDSTVRNSFSYCLVTLVGELVHSM